MGGWDAEMVTNFSTGVSLRWNGLTAQYEKVEK
jgi:hypothetical protein